MQEDITQLSIEDIVDFGETAGLFGLGVGDALEIGLMDVVIAVIGRP